MLTFSSNSYNFIPTLLLQLLAGHLEPLTDQQLVGISNLQQSSQQAEDALSQGMEALQQSLAETLASGSLGPAGPSGNVANYMGQMAMAMGKLGTLENFLRQVCHAKSWTCSFHNTVPSLFSLICWLLFEVFYIDQLHDILKSISLRIKLMRSLYKLNLKCQMNYWKGLQLSKDCR
jgi:hypothetical protein